MKDDGFGLGEPAQIQIEIARPAAVFFGGVAHSRKRAIVEKNDGELNRAQSS
jgi:hypothetical protein